MKIYKFKDLTDAKTHCHFLQIVLENKIWCASPDTLNDEDEFKFKLDYTPSIDTASLLAQVLAKNPTENRILSPQESADLVLENEKLENIATPIIENLKNQCRNSIGVTSFSAIKTSKHLWAEYGGKGNGVCVAIDIPKSLINQLYHSVDYKKKKIFHVDSFLQSTLSPDKAFETFRNILLTKTEKKWSQEEEIRFIGKQQNVTFIFDGKITEIIFGSHVPKETFNMLETKIGDYCISNNITITKL